LQVIKGERYTFHVGVKNGGWGLHRDAYEGYNRLSRKMAEASLVNLASWQASRGHKGCVAEALVLNSGQAAAASAVAGSDAAAASGATAPWLAVRQDAGASASPEDAAAASCARRGVAANGALQEHATGLGALKPGRVYRRIKDVHKECHALRSHLAFAHAAVDELAKLGVSRRAEVKVARDAAAAAHRAQELGVAGGALPAVNVALA
jgi:hypothetical protein